MMRLTNGRLWTALCLLVLLSTAAWAADEQKPVAGNPVAKKAADPVSAKPADTKPSASNSDPEKADLYAVPNGTPAELVAYIKKVATTPPADAETQAKAKQAILKAAEKILTQKPNDEEREIAVRAKMMMLSDEKQLADFSQELAKAGHPKLARMVHGFSLQLQLRHAVSSSKDEKEKKEEMKKAVEEILTYFEEGKPETADIGLAFMAGRIAELTGDNDLAVRTYGSLALAFGASKDARLAEFSKTLAGIVRRLQLLGKEMKIEGTSLDGKDFDWSKYAGKVVLVDFWATWCAPCVAEIPSLKKAYDLYHDKGFEIVGISCDRRLSDLDKFVKEKSIPWAIVFGGDKPSPTVNYYGIMGIPTQILIDQKGKVVSLNARGEALQQELTKLLGPAEEKKAASPETKKAEAKPSQSAETKDAAASSEKQPDLKS